VTLSALHDVGRAIDVVLDGTTLAQGCLIHHEIRHLVHRQELEDPHEPGRQSASAAEAP